MSTGLELAIMEVNATDIRPAQYAPLAAQVVKAEDGTWQTYVKPQGWKKRAAGEPKVVIKLKCRLCSEILSFCELG